MTPGAYDPEFELRQPPGADAWWQDSAFLEWYSRDAGVGGVFRIGHEPNQGEGTAVLWFGLAAPDGARYRREVATVLDSGDRLPGGFGAMGGSYRITFDGVLRYEVDDEDCRVRLEAQDFYTPTHLFPESAGMLSEDFAKAHFEAAGRITGAVELGGTRYEVDGLYQRDRSFGIRRWDTLLNHRWMPGSVGSDLSFGSVAWHATDGTVRTYGYIARGDEITRTPEVDIVVNMLADGTTHRGGQLEMALSEHGGLAVTAKPVAQWLFRHHDTVVVESICECESASRQGFCALEISTNPRAGTGPVTAALGATVASGLSHNAGAGLRTEDAAR